MSKVAINKYYEELDRVLQFGKTGNEQSIRNYFWNLLNDYARKLNYEVVTELAVLGTKGKKVIPDGTVKNYWGLEIGHWESKDEYDDLETEIEAKKAKGYPFTNILFEDSKTAILFQNNKKIAQIDIRIAKSLDKVINDFLGFKSEKIQSFEEAIEKFKFDVPIITKTLREKIKVKRENNPEFCEAQAKFLEVCKIEINPDITVDDIREMMIQHLLTSDIFNKVFGDSDFHRLNNVAAELENLVNKLFTNEERKNLLFSIEHYYMKIRATAAEIADHHEKQKFLKVLYENFYKVYNPKAADRLGVIYTPNEIVQFMVKSVNYLLHKHFERTLGDKNVEILDPAAGTGTFICEIIENAIAKQDLEYKYKNEIHANEVSILPYYIANLNIEFTYKQKMGQYAEFPNFCFVDTLDNIDGLNNGNNKRLLFRISPENTKRIKRQNEKKISVIIGNPPYNANQKNENENNKNREYKTIDELIKNSFVKFSKAQKTKAYDMFARFYRWAMNRIEKKGIIAFVTNSSYIDKKTFDGFRKCIREEFAYAYIVDLGGEIRDTTKDKKSSVFNIKVGVAIMILVKKEDGKPSFRISTSSDTENVSHSIKKSHKLSAPCRIFYYKLDETMNRKEKLDWLRFMDAEELEWTRIRPDENNNWINISEESDWESLIPVASKTRNNAIFDFCSLGVSTNRDDWVYDFDKNNLHEKVKFFVQKYNELLSKNDVSWDTTIKWSAFLKNVFSRKKKIRFKKKLFVKSFYRPFIRKHYYAEHLLSDRLTRNHHKIWGKNLKTKNPVITFSHGKRGRLFTFCINSVFSLDIYMPDAAFCLPLKICSQDKEQQENVTDWGLEQFTKHYKDEKITKEDIFHYVYAVLHNPAYRKKYEMNLRREFPRIPFYDDFFKWANWGKQLMDLHINFETVEPYPLEIIEVKDPSATLRIQVAERSRSFEEFKPRIKVKLRAFKETGTIELDDVTKLCGIPEIAWEYKLGNRSALEWILDQHKEKSVKDETIAENFDNYKFSDYKSQVIDLLQRVCNVSVQTMQIITHMPES